jgi:hypothetical protein
MALLCDLAIPLVVIVGVGLSLLIDPEMARGHADYARAYRGLDVARGSGLIATAALALPLWIACCSLVLVSHLVTLIYLLSPIAFNLIAPVFKPR